MTFVDTNVILRWYLEDHAILSGQAKQILDDSQTGEFLISDVVLGEIFYVLRGLNHDNRQIAEVYTGLLEQPNFIFDQESRLSLLVEIIAKTKLDFADCYLISRAVYSGEQLETFDKAMQKTYDKYKTA